METRMGRGRMTGRPTARRVATLATLRMLVDKNNPAIHHGGKVRPAAAQPWVVRSFSCRPQENNLTAHDYHRSSSL